MKTWSKLPSLDKNQVNIIKIKQTLLLMGHELSNSNNNSVKILGTTLFLMAFTVAYFIIDLLQETKSVKINIRKCDMINPGSNYKHSSMNESEELK